MYPWIARSYVYYTHRQPPEEQRLWLKMMTWMLTLITQGTQIRISTRGWCPGETFGCWLRWPAGAVAGCHRCWQPAGQAAARDGLMELEPPSRMVVRPESGVQSCMATSTLQSKLHTHFFFLFQRLVGHQKLQGRGIYLIVQKSLCTDAWSGCPGAAHKTKEKKTLIMGSFLNPTFARQLKFQAARVPVFLEHVKIHVQ